MIYIQWGLLKSERLSIYCLLLFNTQMSYLDHKCRKCNTDFHYQVPRGFVLKQLLGFVPVRIYWCPKCTTNRYVWITEKKKGLV